MRSNATNCQMKTKIIQQKDIIAIVVRQRIGKWIIVSGLANAPIVETKFLELAMSLLDFSPRIPLGTFSILLT